MTHRSVTDALGPPEKKRYFKLPPGLRITTVMNAVTDDRGAGFCMECGEERDGFTEPDACNYPCGYCETNTVFGAEEVIIMVVA